MVIQELLLLVSWNVKLVVTNKFRTCTWNKELLSCKSHLLPGRMNKTIPQGGGGFL